MIRRQVTLPAEPAAVWEAITTPAALEEWFGGRVDWDLRPGGGVLFDDGAGRWAGVVREVVPERALRFLWWPDGQEDDASEVAYELTPDEEGTTLTVTERRVSLPVADGGAGTDVPSASASAAGGCGPGADDAVGCWALADQALLAAWSAVGSAAWSAVGSAAWSAVGSATWSSTGPGISRGEARIALGAPRCLA